LLIAGSATPNVMLLADPAARQAQGDHQAVRVIRKEKVLQRLFASIPISAPQRVMARLERLY
jgi:hypothetical protein